MPDQPTRDPAATTTPDHDNTTPSHHQAAIEIIHTAASDISGDTIRHHIGNTLRTRVGPAVQDADVQDSDVAIVSALITTARVLVDWPGSTTPNHVDDLEALLTQAYDHNTEIQNKLARITTERDRLLEANKTVLTIVAENAGLRDRADRANASRQLAQDDLDAFARQVARQTNTIDDLRQQLAQAVDVAQDHIDISTLAIRYINSREGEAATAETYHELVHAVRVHEQRQATAAPILNSSPAVQDEPVVTVHGLVPDAPASLTAAVAGLVDAVRRDVGRLTTPATRDRHAEGYAAAVAMLRDNDRYRDWWQGAQHQPTGPVRHHLADYLETIGPDGPDVTAYRSRDERYADIVAQALAAFGADHDQAVWLSPAAAARIAVQALADRWAFGPGSRCDTCGAQLPRATGGTDPVQCHTCWSANPDGEQMPEQGSNSIGDVRRRLDEAIESALPRSGGRIHDLLSELRGELARLDAERGKPARGVATVPVQVDPYGLRDRLDEQPATAGVLADEARQYAWLPENTTQDTDPDPFDHTLTITGNAWSIGHPDECDVKVCPMVRLVREQAADNMAPGRYEIGVNDLRDRLLIGDRIDTPEADQ